MADLQATEKIWMNGEFVDWADATVHVGVHGLHYGSGVFEGIRAYETTKGTAIFRLGDHLQRLHDSARLLRMTIPYSVEDLRKASLELVGVNKLPSCYVRPIAFYGYGSLGVPPRDNPVCTAIMCWPWGAYLGEEGMTRGVRVKISSWVRMPSNVVPHASKACGLYLNSMLAVQEAALGGYEEAILLTEKGYIADCSGENVFIVKDGVVYTPPLETGILHGITRNTVMELAVSLGYEVKVENLTRADLYLADEAFMTGTAAEVTPVREVDDYLIGDPGPVTLALQRAYLDIVQGRDDRWASWLEYVTPARAKA
ncbi:MAG TPA: branched-chain amino acid transaminase [Gaiellaceae bacterium]